MIKYLSLVIAFTLTAILLSSVEFPLFWKFVASGIVAMGIFFAFHNPPNTHASDMIHGHAEGRPTTQELSSSYLPINEYNKKFGLPTNDIKQKITSGELKGAQVNGIWYIHQEEMKDELKQA